MNAALRGGCAALPLPQVLRQLRHEVRLLFLHILHDGVVGVADFHALREEKMSPVYGFTASAVMIEKLGAFPDAHRA